MAASRGSWRENFAAASARVAVVVSQLVAATLLSHGCATASEEFPPPAYSAKEIRATVVDGATGQPLEDVVVVARWVLRRMYGDGPQLHIAETVTDRQGTFLIPAWGPKPRPALMALTHKSPQLLLFKHGYVPLELDSGESKEEFAKRFPNYRNMKSSEIKLWMTITKGYPNRAMQEAFWDGLTIQLEPFRGTEERWFELLRSFFSSSRHDDARQIPRLSAAVYAERTYFNLSGFSPYKRGEVEGFFESIKRGQR
ncbi:MAG: hypothetical protein ACHQ50_13150 [Fimbriimonadales bacterium]